jgi:hypothetical protein
VSLARASAPPGQSAQSCPKLSVKPTSSEDWYIIDLPPPKATKRPD